VRHNQLLDAPSRPQPDQRVAVHDGHLGRPLVVVVAADEDGLGCHYVPVALPRNLCGRERPEDAAARVAVDDHLFNFYLMRE
jgi:hypothetical protein